MENLERLCRRTNHGVTLVEMEKNEGGAFVHMLLSSACTFQLLCFSLSLSCIISRPISLMATQQTEEKVPLGPCPWLVPFVSFEMHQNKKIHQNNNAIPVKRCRTTWHFYTFTIASPTLYLQAHILISQCT